MDNSNMSQLGQSDGISKCFLDILYGFSKIDA